MEELVVSGRKSSQQPSHLLNYPRTCEGLAQVTPQPWHWGRTGAHHTCEQSSPSLLAPLGPDSCPGGTAVPLRSLRRRILCHGGALHGEFSPPLQGSVLPPWKGFSPAAMRNLCQEDGPSPFWARLKIHSTQNTQKGGESACHGPLCICLIKTHLWKGEKIPLATGTV